NVYLSPKVIHRKSRRALTLTQHHLRSHTHTDTHTHTHTHTQTHTNTHPTPHTHTHTHTHTPTHTPTHAHTHRGGDAECFPPVEPQADGADGVFDVVNDDSFGTHSQKLIYDG